MFLSVREVSVNYGKLEAVKSVSLDIPRGTIVSLLGANGAGKTTLFRAISGLTGLASGNIWFEGERIDLLPPDARLRLGVAQVSEGKKIFPYMTVLQNLNLGAYSRKDGKREIDRTRAELFERFPMLREKANVKAENLSGGQQQILVIARALMSKPKLLLMDEPAQGLAPLVIKEITEVIRDIQESGITIGLIEHNIRFVLGLAHKIFVLESGRLVHELVPSELSESELVQTIYLGG